jgi:hypothetical protein
METGLIHFDSPALDAIRPSPSFSAASSADNHFDRFDSL